MLQGKTIRVVDGMCRDENGTLAGTALDMASAVRNAVSMLDLDIADAARMASEYPAEFLGLGGELGKIQAGYRANLVALNDGLQVTRTWIDGIAPELEAVRAARHRAELYCTDMQRCAAIHL